MKTSLVLTVVSSLLMCSVATAADWHEADRGIEGTLRTTLNERHVRIHVHQGIVTLEGKVPTSAERERVESLVRSTSGVVAVKDELEVGLPATGRYGANESTIPVYATPPPEVVVPPTVVTVPAPVVIPDYPKLKVQAWTADDQPAAERIAQELRTEAAPMDGLQNVSITIRNGNVSLHGVVERRGQRDALIAAVQRAGGVRAIYDELRVR